MVVKEKAAKVSDTRKRLKRIQQRFRNLRDSLEDALEEATANRKRAERVLVRCRQS